MYIERKRLPAGFRQAPSRNADHSVVTVLAGTLYIGFGESFNESTTRPIPHGNTWTIPARKTYYLWVKEGEVLVQVMSNR